MKKTGAGLLNMVTEAQELLETHAGGRDADGAQVDDSADAMEAGADQQQGLADTGDDIVGTREATAAERKCGKVGTAVATVGVLMNAK